MSRMAVGFSLATIAVGILVGLVGMAVGGSEATAGVVLGAATGVVVQVLIFWGLFVFALPEQKLLAHGLGIAVRFLAVVVFAFIGLGVMNVPAAPALLSLVTCLFVSTMLEPVFLSRELSRTTAAREAEAARTYTS